MIVHGYSEQTGMAQIAIAIDGPAGAGKSTIARAVAAQLQFIYVDTGALYRTIGLAVYRKGLSGDDAAQIQAILPSVSVSLAYIDGAQHVFLCKEDVTEQIRTPEVARYASKVSAVPAVRSFLLDLQRDFAARYSVVMDGRDIGTVILPNAQVKLFLTASPEKRAERRHLELIQKGQTVSFEQVLREQIERDAQDMQRQVAPLRQAEDAVLVDTDSLSLEQSLQAVLAIIREKIGSTSG